MNEMRKLTVGKTGSRAPFRTRLFAMLLLFAVIPTVTVTLLWTGVAARTLSLFSARSAWERIAESGEQTVRIVGTAPLTPEQASALSRHQAELRESVQAIDAVRDDVRELTENLTEQLNRIAANLSVPAK